MSRIGSLGSILVSALWVVSAAIRSEAVVLLLLIHCFVCLSHCLWFLCDFGPCLVMQYFAPYLTLQSSR